MRGNEITEIITDFEQTQNDFESHIKKYITGSKVSLEKDNNGMYESYQTYLMLQCWIGAKYFYTENHKQSI